MKSAALIASRRFFLAAAGLGALACAQAADGGGVSLREISEQRRWAAEAVPEARLNTLAVELAVATDRESPQPRAIRLVRLYPAFDDTGTDLTQGLRATEYEKLRDWKPIEGRISAGSRWAALFSLPLDAAARKAQKLSNLTGELELAAFVEEAWVKGDLAGADGFVLERPDLPGFKIQFQVKRVGQGCEVRLVPEGEGAFILHQVVLNGRREVPFDSLTHSAGDPRGRDTYRYDQLPARAALKVVVGRILAVEKRPFDFSDVALP